MRLLTGFIIRFVKFLMGSYLTPYSDSLLGQSNVVVTSDMFFHLRNDKRRLLGQLKYGWFPSVWGREWDSEEFFFGKSQ